MLAVDTNVVVRFLVDDGAAQHQRAVDLFRTHTVWLPKTVLLETEWVLRSAFGFTREEITNALRGLTSLPSVRCEDAAPVASAIAALSAGMDFADALHLASSELADDGFATFDARFIKRAQQHWPEVAIWSP